MTLSLLPYTELPNYIVDEDYLAKMSGNALKCYIIINRFTRGFKRSGWCLDSDFLMRKTDIKKSETITKATHELAQLGILKIVPNPGYSNKFYVVDPSPQTVVPMMGSTPDEGEGSNPHKQGNPPPHDRGESTHHQQGESTPDERGTKKETNKNKQIEINNQKETRDEKTPFVPQNRPMLDFIEYHPEDAKFYSLKNLAQVHDVKHDFIAQAKVSFPNLTDQQIQNEFSALCQWSLTTEKRVAQKWMSAWLKFLKNPSTEKPSAPTQQNPRNVNDAWGAPKQYAPVTEGEA